MWHPKQGYCMNLQTELMVEGRVSSVRHGAPPEASGRAGDAARNETYRAAEAPQ